MVGNENASFWKQLLEWRFLKILAHKEVLEYDDAILNIDFLKVLRFSFKVPVVDSSAKDEVSLSRSLCHLKQ